MTVTTTKSQSKSRFYRVLYTPHYNYYQGIEEVIKRDMQDLINDHDLSIWSPSKNTIIEVLNGLAYGRSEISRESTTEG
jgi:hypothetical protein